MSQKVCYFAVALLFLLRCSASQAAPQFQRPHLAPTLAAGPDIIAGNISSLVHSGSSGTQVGLAIGTDACNGGDAELNFFLMPNTDHPLTAQNLYRMSGGATNDARFEQIGHSWLLHAFTALQNNSCNFGCISAGNGTHLGVGCSNADTAGINGSAIAVGSRAWVNPFTGDFPSTANNHTGHVHSPTSHRILVETSDLNTTMNPGATYYAEAQYVTPHEYAWCQTHPGECNMDNNSSYRRFNVAGTTTFAFAAVGSTVRMTSALNAWTGATIHPIEPAPGVDGRAFVAYKVTNPSAGVWHYEYAVYNQNLDRAIQSFGVPLGCGITVSNLGFHAPPNHPGFPNDGTQGDLGFSNAAWTANQTGSALSWSSETFAQDQNANAIRWGTLYNFRFDSNRPPQTVNATVGFFKTGAPITVAIQAPAPDQCTPLQLTGAVSRKTHAGAGTMDINLPLTGAAGVESRSGGTAGDHIVVVTFGNNVVSGNAAVTSGVASIAGSPTFAGNAMTVNLTGVGNAQTIAVTLSNVTDEFAQVMADTSLNASFLIGDTNGDRSVNAADALQTRSRAGQAADTGNFRSDVNHDGIVNSGDTLIVRGQAGNSVP